MKSVPRGMEWNGFGSLDSRPLCLPVEQPWFPKAAPWSGGISQPLKCPYLYDVINEHFTYLTYLTMCAFLGLLSLEHSQAKRGLTLHLNKYDLFVWKTSFCKRVLYFM